MRRLVGLLILLSLPLLAEGCGKKGPPRPPLRPPAPAASPAVSPAP